VGGLGALGIVVARDSVNNAPVVVGLAVAAAVIGVALRERGFAVAALGVAATAAFATPAGLGPMLVATGAVIGARPELVDRRVAEWPEIVHAAIALPGLAGLAGVVAAQPSQRGVVVGAAAGVLAVATWWRGPRHASLSSTRPSVAAFLGLPAAAGITLAPDRLDALGALPAATINAGRGAAAAVGVFAVTCLIQAVHTQRDDAKRLRRGQHAARRV